MNDWSDFGKVDIGGGTNPDLAQIPIHTAASADQRSEGSGWASPYTDPASGKFISSEALPLKG